LFDIPSTAFGVAAKRKWHYTFAGHTYHFGQCPSNSSHKHTFSQQLATAAEAALLQPMQPIRGVAIAAIEKRRASRTILQNSTIKN
jgi:hypothetical protein